MTWTLKPFTTSRWRPLLLVAGSLATLLAVGDARAELTEAQMQAAMLAALKEYAEYSSGEDWAILTIPSDYVGSELCQLLKGSQSMDFTSGDSVGISAQELVRQLAGIRPQFRDLLASVIHSSVPSNSIPVDLLETWKTQALQDSSSIYSLLYGNIAPDLSTISTVANRFAFDSSSGLGNLYVRDDALYSLLNNFKTSVDYSLYGIDQGVIGGFRDLRDALDDSATDNQNILSRLDSIIYNQQQQTEILSPSTDPYPPSELTAPQSSNPEIASVAVAAPSTSALQNSFDGFSQSGTPVVEFWKDVTLLGYSIPDASIDLSEGVLGRCVTVMGKISRTLWYVLYYGLLATLLRREYVYYTSLGHTEGAA